MLRRFVVVLLALVLAIAVLAKAGRLLLPEADLPVWDTRRGEAVFWGRGLCSSCHEVADRAGGYRGPSLDGVAERAASRVHGLDAVGYLVQSLYEPSAFTAPGYPEGLMPAMHEPPVGLAHDDLTAVVAYLLDGPGQIATPRTIAAIRARQEAYLGDRRAPVAAPVGDAGRGAALWLRHGCAECHVLAGVTTPEQDRTARTKGPDLTGIGAYQSAGYLRDSIVDPNRIVVRGQDGEYLAEDGLHSKMPSYRLTMTDAEVADLVAWLAGVR